MTVHIGGYLNPGLLLFGLFAFLSAGCSRPEQVSLPVSSDEYAIYALSIEHFISTKTRPHPFRAVVVVSDSTRDIYTWPYSTSSHDNETSDRVIRGILRLRYGDTVQVSHLRRSYAGNNKLHFAVDFDSVRVHLEAISSPTKDTIDLQRPPVDSISEWFQRVGPHEFAFSRASFTPDRRQAFVKVFDLQGAIFAASEAYFVKKKDGWHFVESFCSASGIMDFVRRVKRPPARHN